MRLIHDDEEIISEIVHQCVGRLEMCIRDRVVTFLTEPNMVCCVYVI